MPAAARRALDHGRREPTVVVEQSTQRSWAIMSWVDIEDEQAGAVKAYVGAGQGPPCGLIMAGSAVARSGHALISGGALRPAGQGRRASRNSGVAERGFGERSP